MMMSFKLRNEDEIVASCLIKMQSIMYVCMYVCMQACSEQIR